ncbi:MAG: NAD-dependent epimerase/dehydratase family protein [bacterium]|jgi:UDP-2-acetamido-2,6-beta-L-arabino-hexul-4-ose reductase|nr:NAD-dependent epimerase/dehydratase family protein [Betaproteobacteria bacterium]
MSAPVPQGPRIAITGGAGFLGWHLRCAIRMRGWPAPVVVDRAGFEDPVRLREALAGVDAVAHLAGVNRGPEAEVEAGNPMLARTLVAALQAAGPGSGRLHLLFANSTHGRDRDAVPAASLTPYGRSKRQAGAILGEWAASAAAAGAAYTDIRFPHLFGEHGRPFYNSAVATFCHQLASGETPRIIVDSEVELLHAQSACDHILDAIEARTEGALSPAGRRMPVSEALARLQAMHATYADGSLPRFDGDFDVDLFNTLRSYRFPLHYPGRIELRSDARGHLFEAVKTGHGGQCFASTTHPGIVRGNHFHRRKIERFLVAGGEATIRVRRLFTANAHAFAVRGDAPVYIDMPTLHTHDIRNTGQGELFTLFWSHEIFDPAAPDTYPEAV